MKYVSGGSYNAGTRVLAPGQFCAAGTQNFVLTVTANTGSYYAPTLYLDDPVAGTSIPTNFTATTTTAAVWSVSTAQSQSPPNSLFTPDVEGVSEQILTTTNAVTLGANQSSLSFWHNDHQSRFRWGVLEILPIMAELD